MNKPEVKIAWEWVASALINQLKEFVSDFEHTKYPVHEAGYIRLAPADVHVIHFVHTNSVALKATTIRDIDVNLYACVAKDGPCAIHLDQVDEYKSSANCSASSCVYHRSMWSAKTDTRKHKNRSDRQDRDRIYLLIYMMALVAEIGESGTMATVNAALAYGALTASIPMDVTNWRDQTGNAIDVVESMPDKIHLVEALTDNMVQIPAWARQGKAVAELVNFIVSTLVYPSSNTSFGEYPRSPILGLWNKMADDLQGIDESDSITLSEMKELAEKMVDDLLWTKSALMSSTDAKTGKSTTRVIIHTNSFFSDFVPLLHPERYTKIIGKKAAGNIERHLSPSYLDFNRDKGMIYSFMVEQVDPDIAQLTIEIAEGKTEVFVSNSTPIISNPFSYDSLSQYSPTMNAILANTALRKACQSVVDTGALFLSGLID